VAYTKKGRGGAPPPAKGKERMVNTSITGIRKPTKLL